MASKVRSLLSVALFAGVQMFLLSATARAATPAADTLLPATTRAVLSLPNTPNSIGLWEKSLGGQLLADPQLDPFVKDLRRQLEAKWREENSRLGFKWDDLKPVISGEMAFGIVHQEGKAAGMILLADATGNEDAARRLLDKAEGAMLEKRAKRTTQTIAGIEVAIYDEPRRNDDPPNKVRRACYFLAGSLLGASSQVEVCNEVLSRLKGGAANLASVASYQAVVARCDKDGGNEGPQLRWWADPIGFLAAAQSAVDPARRRQPDLLKVARAVGFTGVKGVGGRVQLAAQYDILSRAFIYAPKPWEKSMKMFEFANVADFPPQPWVPADVANYGSFNLDIANGEANFEPLFDQLFGDGETGVWTDVKESLRDDPNGPGIDIVKDLIAHLGNRITLLADYTTPTTLDCERTCLAIEVKNPQPLAESIRKSMESDPNVRRREFEGNIIWEMLEEEFEGPAVERENLPGQKQEVAEEAAAAGGDRLMPRSSVCVAQGHLFVASSIPFLERLLTKRKTEETLAASPEYTFVDAELKKLNPGQQSFRFFTRLDDVVRPHYDFLKNNQFPQAKTSLANGINRIMNGDRDRTEIRQPEVDGSKLPEYETVRKYFGVGGGLIVTEEDGWYIVSFTAPKAPPQQAGAALGRARGEATR